MLKKNLSPIDEYVYDCLKQTESHGELVNYVKSHEPDTQWLYIKKDVVLPYWRKQLKFVVIMVSDTY